MGGGNQIAKSKRPRIAIYASTEQHEYLTQWAAQEHRSVSGLLSKIVDAAIRQHKDKMALLENFKPLTVADIVRRNLPKLKQTGLKNLQAIADGEVLPTAVDFAKIAAVLEIPDEEQKTIWENTFIQSRQQGIGNGCSEVP